MESLDDDLGQEYLDQFDELDFSQGMAQRRMGMFLIENFYGTVLMEIGRQALQCDDSIRNDPVYEQWEEIHGRLRSTLNELDKETRPLYEYQELVKNKVKSNRNRVYHEFDEGISEDTLEELRASGEELRTWLLDAAEDYHELHGPYTKSEFSELKERVEYLTEKDNYTNAVQLLREELDHATRCLLKEEGVAGPFWKPEGHIHLHEEIDRYQMQNYQNVRLAEQEEDLDPEQYDRVIQNGFDVLEVIYKSQNPFEKSQLSADDLAEAINDEYNVVERNNAARYIIAEVSIEIDGEVVENAGLQVYPGEDSVIVSSIEITETSDLSDNTRQKIEKYSTSKWWDCRNDEDGTIVWKIGTSPVESRIEEIEAEMEDLLNQHHQI